MIPIPVEAVMEFARAEGLEGNPRLEIKEGVWDWREGRNFATISLGRSEWMVAPSEEQAERLAVAMVKQQLDDEPELWAPSWLESYIDEDKLRNYLSGDVENDVRENPESYGWEPPGEGDEEERDDIKVRKPQTTKGGQGKLDFDPAPPEPTDEWVENKVEAVLRNPLKYLEGIYGDEAHKQAIKMVGIDEERAIQDAIAADGIGFFLSPEERDIHRLPGGGVWWRYN